MRTILFYLLLADFFVLLADFVFFIYYLRTMCSQVPGMRTILFCLEAWSAASSRTRAASSLFSFSYQCYLNTVIHFRVPRIARIYFSFCQIYKFPSFHIPRLDPSPPVILSVGRLWCSVVPQFGFLARLNKDIAIQFHATIMM